MSHAIPSINGHYFPVQHSEILLFNLVSMFAS
jgi:hypothetical protein